MGKFWLGFVAGALVGVAALAAALEWLGRNDRRDGRISH